MSNDGKLTRILSIDGGGIRGIIPGQVLVYLEKKLREISGNTDSSLSDYFDIIAGTSTGGILTCAYLTPDPEKPGRPKFSAEEAVKLYLERGSDIFHRSLWQKIRSVWGFSDEKHSEKSIERAFMDYFGDTKLSELLKPSLITAYDTERRSALFFTQHNAAASGRDFLVRDVVRATSAAPSYFEAAGIKSLSGVFYSLVDGGVFASNPAMCAYAEARKTDFGNGKKNPTAREMLILSIGTGLDKKVYPYKKVKRWGALEWIRPVIGIMMSGVSETVDFQLKQIYNAVNAECNYLRITPDLKGASPQMDNVSEENLAALKRAGEVAVETYRSRLDNFAKQLINNK